MPPPAPAGAQPQGAVRDRSGVPKPADAASRPSEAPRPTDAAAQRRADAAQRERMQRAQGATRPPALPGGPLPPAVPPANAGPGGRRLANDAWLRRVPDDPGGLLREKFKLEERRRRREDDR